MDSTAMDLPTLTTPLASDLMTSVWLYSTEKGRESKKRPYKYWMNNTEMFFEVYISHPSSNNPDVAMLLESTYKAFVQSARILSYENEKKHGTPVTYIPSNVFSNPMVDDIRLVAMTNYGWRIPFRCNISLPIDKVRYIKLYIQHSSIEFGLYSKASSKNKLDAGTPVLFPLLRENEIAMVSQNTPPLYIQVPVGTDPRQALTHNSTAIVPSNSFEVPPTPSHNASFTYDQFIASPNGSEPSFEQYSSDEAVEAVATFQFQSKQSALRSSNSSMGLSHLLIDENESISSDEEYTARRRIRRRSAENTNSRRMVAKKKLSKSGNTSSRFSPDFPNPQSSPEDSTSLSPVSPNHTDGPALVNNNTINPNVPPASDLNKMSDIDKPYLEARQFSLIDPAQLKQVSTNANDLGWVLGKRDIDQKQL